MRYPLAKLAALAALSIAAPAMAQDAHAGHAHHLPQPATINPALAAAVADPRRDGDKARDVWRKPAETLSFFQVTPEMKVGEYAPGGGWYSRLLGLYLGPKGKFVGLFFDPTSGAFNERSQQGIRDGAAKFPADVAGWSGQPGRPLFRLYAGIGGRHGKGHV